VSFEKLKEFLLEAFPDTKLEPQESSGQEIAVALPNSILDLYRIVGPNKLTIPAYGNDFYLPSLSELEDYQIGYAIDGRTHEEIPDWPHNWIVIADQGADPFICDTDTGKILYAQHGVGIWEAEEVFESVENMLWVMAITGKIIESTGVDFTDADCYIKEKYVDLAVKKLSEHGFNEGHDILNLLGWC